VLVFSPTAQEVHDKATQFFRDPEVLEWFAANLARITTPSLRLYVRAAELKRAGLPWRTIVPVTPQNFRLQLVADLRTDASLTSEATRAAQFAARGGGCRATYFNYLRRFRANCGDSIDGDVMRKPAES
jgi:hypothetical protein